MTRLNHILLYAIKRFWLEGFSYRAASLVFASLLSLIPLLIIALSILSIFPWFQGIGHTVQNLIWQNFVVASASHITLFFDQFTQQLQHFSLYNLAFLFIICLLLLLNMSHAFNTIWRVNTGHSFIASVCIYVTLLLIAPLLIGIGLITTTYLASLKLISDVHHIPLIQHIALYISPILLTFCVFTFANWILPTTRVKWRYAALGGLVTAILFEVAKYGFALYITLSTTYRLLYGTLAIIPIFLIWLYVSWVLILLGGLIAKGASEFTPAASPIPDVDKPS